ncbi:MAG TPA: YdeI/OmpD-associated family protein, partial [Candidatus Angelobacter sp.]|nr:YdeI/OmpD-associated family protein [Candidatus Angelobacter sp.]
HPLLLRALRRHRLKRFFNSLSPTLRIDFDHFIRSVKKETTRLRRLDQTIELLTTAREAELDPPPALATALAQNEQARRGWEIMPQQSRRGFLIDIFRSPYPETRARHLAWAIREWARYAEMHNRAWNVDEET